MTRKRDKYRYAQGQHILCAKNTRRDIQILLNGEVLKNVVKVNVKRGVVRVVTEPIRFNALTGQIFTNKLRGRVKVVPIKKD